MTQFQMENLDLDRSHIKGGRKAETRCAEQWKRSVNFSGSADGLQQTINDGS